MRLFDNCSIFPGLYYVQNADHHHSASKTKKKLVVQISLGDSQWNAAFCKAYILAGRIKAEDNFPFRK